MCVCQHTKGISKCDIEFISRHCQDKCCQINENNDDEREKHLPISVNFDECQTKGMKRTLKKEDFRLRC